jgi:DNA-binding MarR family transcriptional regulator
MLLEKPFSSSTEIAELTGVDMGRLCKILTQLVEENLVIRKRKGYAIAEN